MRSEEEQEYARSAEKEERGEVERT